MTEGRMWSQMSKPDALHADLRFPLYDPLGATPDAKNPYVTMTDMGLGPTILEFGADPSGDNDSSQAVRDAIASGYPVRGAPGRFRFDTAVSVTTPVVIDLGPAIRIPVGGTTEQCTIFTENDINLFEIRSEQVVGFGGVFDMTAVTSGTKAALYYPLVCNGSVAGGEGDNAGWGISWDGFIIRGNPTSLQTTGGGSTGIHFDFANGTVNFAYWTHARFRGEIRSCRYGVHASAKNSGYSQWANTMYLDLDCTGVKTVLHNESFNRVRGATRHQGSHIFGSQADADASPSIYSRTSDNVWDHCLFWDFGAASSGGLYTNEVSYDIICPTDDDVLKGESGFAWAENLGGVILAESSKCSGVRTETSNNLADVTHEINALGYKRKGFYVFNENTNKPVWASGEAASATWKDADGNDAHAPV